MMAEQTKVAIIAFGMEHCKRGVEVHARMLFEKLKSETFIDVILVKGSGMPKNDEFVLSVPKRHTLLNRVLGRLRGYNVYWEQVFFMFKLFFFLLRKARKLDYIYTQEYVHIIGMGRLKHFFGWDFKLIYCEGFVSQTPTRVKYADILQEVNKNNYQYILPHANDAQKRCSLIPHFFDPIWEEKPTQTDELEKILRFKGDRKLLLYVGPTELTEKNFIRIQEAVSVLGNEWTLLICGDVSHERLELMNKESECKTMSVYVSHEIMQRIYPIADLFVLPSIDEAFGIATIEAMAHGVPVLLHDSDHSVWLCNDRDQCTDMTRPNAVIEFVSGIDDFERYRNEKGGMNQAYFLNTFTWEHLKEDYLKLFSKAR